MDFAGELNDHCQRFVDLIWRGRFSKAIRFLSANSELIDARECIEFTDEYGSNLYELAYEHKRIDVLSFLNGDMMAIAYGNERDEDGEYLPLDYFEELPLADSH